MRRLLIALAALLALAVWCAPAHATFPGADGRLAVVPVTGDGLRLVSVATGQSRRWCPAAPVTGAATATGIACGRLTSPSWSPDGRALAFADSTGGAETVGAAYFDGRCLDCAISGGTEPAFSSGQVNVSYSADGLKKTTIDGVHTVALGGRATAADWSSNAQLAVERRGEVLWGVPGHLHAVAPGGKPSWSPDDRELAFAQHGWVMTGPPSGPFRRLVRGRDPVWSPSGRSLAFIGSAHAVEVLAASGGRPRRIGTVTGRALSWQPRPGTTPAPTGRLCVLPAGTVLLGQTTTAEVATDAPAAGAEALIGCDRTSGQIHLLARLDTAQLSGGAGELLPALVDGVYAAVGTITDTEPAAPSNEGAISVDVYDLATGAPDGSEHSSCAPGSVPSTCAYGGMVLSANGDSALDFGAFSPSYCTAPPPMAGEACWGGVIVAHWKGNNRDVTVAGTTYGQGNLMADGGQSPLTGLALTGRTLSWVGPGGPASAVLH